LRFSHDALQRPQSATLGYEFHLQRIEEVMIMRKMLNRKMSAKACPDCNALPGTYHELGCYVERCPYCGDRLVDCLIGGGCLDADAGPLWPPPHDDRDVWTGEMPGARECREFGWYSRTLSGQGRVPCRPEEPGAQEDIYRLYTEAEWKRDRKRFVRTTFTEALSAIEQHGILVSRGRRPTRAKSVNFLIKHAARDLKRGKPVQGYAYYTDLGKWKKIQGKDFAIYFGQVVDPHGDPVGLPAVKVGEVICDCLGKKRVKYSWAGDASKPIRIFTKSIVILPVDADEDVGSAICK
jgi:hypothetical protein